MSPRVQLVGRAARVRARTRRSARRVAWERNARAMVATRSADGATPPRACFAGEASGEVGTVWWSLSESGDIDSTRPAWTFRATRATQGGADRGICDPASGTRVRRDSGCDDDRLWPVGELCVEREAELPTLLVRRSCLQPVPDGGATRRELQQFLRESRPIAAETRLRARKV